MHHLPPGDLVSAADHSSAPGRSARRLLAVLSLWVLAVGGVSADEVLRIARDAAGAPQALEVAVLRFEDGAGRAVDLVGAVHVGEPGYFDALNRRLQRYDRVLFELVGDPEALAAPRPGGLSLIGLMQGGMKDALGLVHQLETVDYSPEHFVHADLDAAEFRDTMRERRESWLQLMFRAWALGLATQGAPGSAETDLLKLLLAEDRQLALRRLFATQLAEQADLLERLSGPEGSTLIEVRNRRALDVLREELAGGQRSLAIFYGAGHLPDLALRLEQEFGFERVAVEWMPAWDLRPAD